MLAEPELFDLEAEPLAFDELAFAFLSVNALAPAPIAPVIAPPAAPETTPLATLVKTSVAEATKPCDELFDELALEAGFLAEDDLFALEGFVPEDFAEDFEPELDDLLPAPDFEAVFEAPPDDLLDDVDFEADFEPVDGELFAEDDFVPDDFEAVDFGADFGAGFAEAAFLLPADVEDLLADEDDLLAPAFPLEVDDFAESLFDFVVAIFLSLGYVKNVLKQTYERIFTRINSVCQEIFCFNEFFSKK